MKTNVVVAVAMVMGLVTMGVAWAAEVEEKEEKSVISFGAFDLGDGKTVLMVSENKLGGGLHCITPDQPCGALHHCCEGLKCNGFFEGKCQRQSRCSAKNYPCALIGKPCCYPLVWSGLERGSYCTDSNGLPPSTSTLESFILRPNDYSSLIQQVV